MNSQETSHDKTHIAKWLFNNTRSICYQDLLFVENGDDNFVVDAVYAYAQQYIEKLDEANELLSKIYESGADLQELESEVRKYLVGEQQ